MENKKHLIIDTLNQYNDYFIRKKESTELKENSEVQKIAFASLIPFARDIEQKDFELAPLDILSIWDKTLELFPINPYENCYFRYELSRAITCAYCTNKIEDKSWGDIFNKSTLYFDYLSKLIVNDPKSGEHFKQKINEIRKSYLELVIASDHLNFRDENLVALNGDWGNGLCPYLHMIHYAEMGRKNETK
ncbi:MAG: hypothetical protein WC781_00800 [Candidatus Pacearchaeota archaeon]|jgi:hypothetical protein